MRGACVSKAPGPNTWRLQIREEIDLTGAVAEPLDGQPHLVNERQPEIGERSILRELDVAAPLRLAATAPDEQHRQVVMEVDVAVAHARPVHDERMIQQRAVAIRNRVQLREEV